jgi:hypothetical protein
MLIHACMLGECLLYVRGLLICAANRTSNLHDFCSSWVLSEVHTVFKCNAWL